jgi:hypothetical protein
MDEVYKKEIARRMYCAKCGLTWKHTHQTDDVIFQKGFLQEQLMKVDAMLRQKRELCKKYPTSIALRISYDSLTNHRKILVSTIGMVHSPIQFESIEN